MRRRTRPPTPPNPPAPTAPPVPVPAYAIANLSIVKTALSHVVIAGHVGSATDEHTLTNNHARAVVRILHPPPSPVCRSAHGPTARIDC